MAYLLVKSQQELIKLFLETVEIPFNAVDTQNIHVKHVSRVSLRIQFFKEGEIHVFDSVFHFLNHDLVAELGFFENFHPLA